MFSNQNSSKDKETTENQETTEIMNQSQNIGEELSKFIQELKSDQARQNLL